MDLLRFLSSTQLTNQFLARVAYFVASQAHVLIRDSTHVLARDEAKLKERLRGRLLSLAFGTTYG